LTQAAVERLAPRETREFLRLARIEGDEEIGDRRAFRPDIVVHGVVACGAGVGERDRRIAEQNVSQLQDRKDAW